MHQPRKNLFDAGVQDADIVITGITFIDAKLTTQLKKLLVTVPTLEELAENGQQTLLVSVHRRETCGGAMPGIERTLARLANAYLQ